MIEDFDAQHRWAVTERARLLVELGRFDEAAEVLRAELVCRPQDGELLVLAALAELGGARVEAAEATAREAVEVSGGDEPSWRVLSAVLEAQDRLDDAEDAARAAVAADPSSWLAQLRLAAVLARQPGRTASARDAAAQAVELAPREAQAHHDLALAALADGDAAAAERSLLRALELDPSHDSARTQLRQLRGAAPVPDPTPRGWVRGLLRRRGDERG